MNTYEKLTGYTGIHAGNIRMLACVADPLNLLYRLRTDCTNGLDECVGRLQRRITDAYDCQVSNIRKHLNAFSIFLNNVEKCNFKKPCKDVFITNFNNVSKCNLSESFHLAQGSAKHFFPYIRMSFVCNNKLISFLLADSWLIPITIISIHPCDSVFLVFSSKRCIIKLLLDSVFVIS